VGWSPSGARRSAFGYVGTTASHRPASWPLLCLGILIFLYCIFIIALGLRNVGLIDGITEFYSVNDSERRSL